MNKYTKILGIVALVAVAHSCSDSWDEHYGTDASNSTAATQTLWELITADENLSNFASIASKVNYYRDQTHPQEGYTFETMLNGTQLFTLWCPTNSALTATEWAKWEELAESNPYNVQQQLLANSLSLWRQIATGGGIDTLIMLNGKKQIFDKDALTMSQSPIVETNIAASNGTLHTVSQTVPFVFNLYEYLKDEDNATENDLTTFRDLIIESDTTYFSEDNSIEGSPDENGNPTYVDSVYFTTNTMFQAKKRFPTTSNTDDYLTYDESFGANIESEDSSFVMILPTNAAWEAAYTMLEPLYNYATVYPDKDKGDSNVSGKYREVENTDSLKDKCINMDILSPLCFNLSLQPNAAGQIGKWQMEDFMASNASASYFLNTYGDTLRSDDTWQKEIIFQGTQVEMSNGYGIVTDEWPMPRKLYKPDVIVEVSSRSFYNYDNKTGNVTAYTFSNETASAWVDSVGRVSNDNFYEFAPTSANLTTKVPIKLVGTDGENAESEVLSGKYDIYVVLVPAFYVTSTDSIEGSVTKAHVAATLSYANGATTDATETSSKYDYDGEKVDTLLLFEDFEFPYSYKNIRQSYPTIQLTTSSTSSERKNGYSNTIYVDQFILRSKED